MEDRSNGSSEEELLRLRNEGKISEAEYEQLHSAMQNPSALESRASADSQQCQVTRELYAFRKRVLLTGLVICLIGLPSGLVLNLPLVWSLSILGIILVPIKLYLVNKKLHCSNQVNHSYQFRKK